MDRQNKKGLLSDDEMEQVTGGFAENEMLYVLQKSAAQEVDASLYGGTALTPDIAAVSTSKATKE